MSKSIYALEESEIPEELRPLNSSDEISEILEYQSGYADYSIVLSEIGTKQFIRVFYLKNLRENWTWVDGTDDGVGFVLLEEK